MPNSRTNELLGYSPNTRLLIVNADDFGMYDAVEVEVEFRAQIEAMLTAGLKPTHLDWHCLHNAGRADILDMTVELAIEFGLALRVYDPSTIEKLPSQGLPPDDHDLLDSYDLDTVDKSPRYIHLLRELPMGLSEWAVHPGLDNSESQARDPGGWQVRQTDFEFLMSSAAREIIQQEGIILISYRALQELWQRK
jgi:predicted glycoside hydrolase/deacetylase ChbG (UPF0249 family)